MDERLSNALKFSNYMITLNNQKKLIKEKFKEKTIYYSNGSKFTISQELINFVNFLVTKKINQFVLLDDNELPVKIENLEEFLENILDQYYASTNEYYNDYQKIKVARSVEKLVDYEQ